MKKPQLVLKNNQPFVLRATKILSPKIIADFQSGSISKKEFNRHLRALAH